jgi:serine/threonine-protein kinase
LIKWLFEPFQERVALAKAAADRALALAPDDPEANLAMGYYYYHGFRDYDAALTYFEPALANRPNDPEVLSAVAFIDRRQGRWEEALEGLQTALELDPLRALNAVEVGTTLRGLRRYEESQEVLERAITLAPEQEEGYRQLAITFQAQGDLSKARATLEAMPREDTAPSIEAWVLQDLYERNYLEALERLSAYPEMPPGQSSRASWEGWIFSLLGDSARSRSAYEIARRQLEEELKQGPLNPWWAYSELGEALLGLGRKEEALWAANRASQLLPISRDSPMGASVARYVAGIHGQAGEYEIALDQLDHLLSIPGGATVSDLRLNPFWDPIRDHPRFQALLEKYGQER